MTTITAEFHSIWDQGYDLETACTVDMQSGLVTIEVSDDVEGLDLLDRQYVQLPGSHVEYGVEEIDGEYFVVNLDSLRTETLCGLM
ncbi:hypothetical protein R2571_006827 [Pseudomonas aeruginosa]|nr:hypothetical protein [Pseudomonas aeruginosa]